MKNYEVIHLDNGLGQLSQVKLTGSVKFRLFYNKKQTEAAYDLISKSLEGIESEEERTAILNEEQEIDLKRIKASELEQIELSLQDIAALEVILDFDS